jgi:uncharacterized protein (TIGR03437 family)
VYPAVPPVLKFCRCLADRRTMSCRAVKTVFWACLAAAAGTAYGQSSGPAAAPGSLTFTYQVNSPTFPVAGKVTVTLPAATALLPMNITVSSNPQGWLTVTPDTGRSPLTLTVTVNPTSLTPGSYTGNISINTVPAGSNPAVVAVTLLISNPPSTLLVSSPSSNYSPPASGTALPSLTFSYTTGALAAIPAVAQLDVASNGDIIPFNVTASGSSTKGTSVWIRVNQSGQLPNLTTSGVALSGSFVPITVALDLSTLASLDPGSYGGLITVAANNPANGTATVAVNLIVSAGPPTLRTSYPIFPASVIAGPTIDPVITIYGDNFFSTSVVAMQLGTNPSITISSKLLSRKVLQATINKGYLAIPTGTVTYPITWSISVTNPAPPNNPAQSPVLTAFQVTDPALPGITSVVNAASYTSTSVHSGTGTSPVVTGATSVSPRQIVSIFGQNLGPVTVSQTSATGTPAAYPTSASGIQVAFAYGTPPATTLAPIIMTSSNQINCIVPVEVASVFGTASTAATIQVFNGTASTSTFTVTIVPADPGAFTFGGLGQGQAAVLNYDSTTGSYTLNASKNAAAKGSTISIYVTGLGDLSTALVNGEVASTAVTLADNTCRVDIDGQPAVVSYAGTSPGAVAGLVQVNAIIPPTVRTGAAIPISVSIGSAAGARRSQPGVTLAIK